MKLFGTKDPVSKLLDSFERDRDFGLGKTILIGIFDLTGYLLLFGLFLIILPMLLPVIILVLLAKLLLFVLTVLESLNLLPSGKQTEPISKERTHNPIRTRWDSGTRR